MELGFYSPSIRRDSLDSCIAAALSLAEKRDFNAIEFWMERNQPDSFALWPWEVDRGAIKKLRSFLKNFKRAGVHLPFVYLNPVSPNPRIAKESIEQINLGIKKSAELGALYCVGHARAWSSKYRDANDDLKIFQELASDWAALAKKCGILFSLETAQEASFPVGELKCVTRMTEEIDSSHFGITLDVSKCLSEEHFYKAYGSLDNWIEKYEKYIFNVHVRGQNSSGGTFLSLESGHDFSGVFTSLKKAGYKGSVIIEEASEEFLHSSTKFFLPYMKSLFCQGRNS
jgi:sugar phosphate isomerase/epimerase